MKNIILVRTGNGIEYNSKIAEQIKNKGGTCRVLSFSELKENNLNKEDLICFRAAGPKIAEYAIKLQKRGIKVINSAETILRTSNKYVSNIFSKKNNIRIPRTIKSNKKDIENLELNYPLIIKPIISRGKGEYCYKIENKKQLNEVISQFPLDEFQIQEFINYKKLYRVIKIGDKILENAVTYDEPTPNKWKCSVCLNPNIKHEDKPPKELLCLAKEIANKFGLEITYIDIFDTDFGYILNEINTACNLVYQERVTGTNIAKLMAEYLINK